MLKKLKWGMTVADIRNEGIILKAFVSGVKTDGRSGGFKVTLDVFPDQAISVMAALSLYMKNVEVNMLEIEDDK